MTEKTLDQKIIEVSETIAKQKSLVESERKRAEVKWSTTGVLNINGLKLTIQVANEEQAVFALAELLIKEEAYNKAAKMLNSETKFDKFKFDGHEISKWREDIETRLSQIKYKKSKEKLEKLESRLKAIMSEDVKRSMEFEAIMKELNS